MKKLKTNTQTKQRLVTLLILVLIMVILSCISNKYLTVNNLINIVRQESTLIIIACAATMLMISGGMDLSPAGVIALTSVVFAKLCVSGISIPLAALLSLFVGIAAGAFSGLLVVMANVPPMIATLGTWYITKGGVCDQQQLCDCAGASCRFWLGQPLYRAIPAHGGDRRGSFCRVLHSPEPNSAREICLCDWRQ